MSPHTQERLLTTATPAQNTLRSCSLRLSTVDNSLTMLGVVAPYLVGHHDEHERNTSGRQPRVQRVTNFRDDLHRGFRLRRPNVDRGLDVIVPESHHWANRNSRACLPFQRFSHQRQKYRTRGASQSKQAVRIPLRSLARPTQPHSSRRTTVPRRHHPRHLAAGAPRCIRSFAASGPTKAADRVVVEMLQPAGPFHLRSNGNSHLGPVFIVSLQRSFGQG